MSWFLFEPRVGEGEGRMEMQRGEREKGEEEEGKESRNKSVYSGCTR